MAAISLTVNGERRTVDVPPDTPLLWVLRDELDLKGTKYSCGMAVCGTCTVELDGAAVRSCVTPIAAAANRRVRTIEGLLADAAAAAGSAPGADAEAAHDRLHRLQRAWLEDEVPQCGYCHPGMLMSAAVLLARNPNPSDEEIDGWMAGNLCRCGTYQRVRRAIRRVVAETTASAGAGAAGGEP